VGGSKTQLYQKFRAGAYSIADRRHLFHPPSNYLKRARPHEKRGETSEREARGEWGGAVLRSKEKQTRRKKICSSKSKNSRKDCLNQCSENPEKDIQKRHMGGASRRRKGCPLRFATFAWADKKINEKKCRRDKEGERWASDDFLKVLSN